MADEHVEIEWLVRHLYASRSSRARVPDIAKAFAKKQGWATNLETVRSLSAEIRQVMTQTYEDCRVKKDGWDWIKLIGTPPAPSAPDDRPLAHGEVSVPSLFRIY